MKNRPYISNNYIFSILAIHIFFRSILKTLFCILVTNVIENPFLKGKLISSPKTSRVLWMIVCDGNLWESQNLEQNLNPKEPSDRPEPYLPNKKTRNPRFLRVNSSKTVSPLKNRVFLDVLDVVGKSLYVLEQIRSRYTIESQNKKDRVLLFSSFIFHVRGRL